MLVYVRNRPLPQCKTCLEQMDYYVPGLSWSDHEHTECAARRIADEILARVFSTAKKKGVTKSRSRKLRGEKQDGK